jgi:hypothetical protein
MVNTYLGTWIHYNRQILAELEKRPGDIVLICFDELAKANRIPYAKLDDWGIQLERVATINPHDVRAWHTLDFDPAFDPELVEAAEQVWTSLELATSAFQSESGN